MRSRAHPNPDHNPDPNADTLTRIPPLSITLARALTPSLPTDPNPDYCPRP